MAGLTIGDPVTFTQALASMRIIAGDTLYIADGTYTGDWVMNYTIKGTSGNPVIVKPRNPGKVIIDGSLRIDGEYVEIYDINFTDSRVDRTLQTNGIYCAKQGFGLYGCIVADQRADGVRWYGSGVGNVNENILLCNGFRVGTDGHGHGVYTHNDQGGERNIQRNIFHDCLNRYGIHLYATSNYIKDFIVKDNVSVNVEVQTGGGHGLIDFLYENNIHYLTDVNHGQYSYDYQNINGIIRGNTHIDLSAYTINRETTPEWDNLVEDNNIVYGGQPADRIGYTVTAKPDSKTWFIPYTKSERWVGAIAVYNNAESTTVAIDLTGLIDAGSYKLRNTQNVSETSDLEYTTGSINIPMTGWTAQAFIGDRDNTCTFPTFGCFVVEKV